MTGMKRDDLRNEVLAMLAASRELTPETDGELAEMLLDTLDKRHGHLAVPSFWMERCQTVSYFLLAAVWTGALALLAGVPLHYYYGDQDVPSSYFQAAPLIVILAVILSCLIYTAGVLGWRVPHIQIMLNPPETRRLPHER